MPLNFPILPSVTEQHKRLLGKCKSLSLIPGTPLLSIIMYLLQGLTAHLGLVAFLLFSASNYRHAPPWLVIGSAAAACAYLFLNHWIIFFCFDTVYLLKNIWLFLHLTVTIKVLTFTCRFYLGSFQLFFLEKSKENCAQSYGKRIFSVNMKLPGCLPE